MPKNMFPHITVIINERIGYFFLIMLTRGFLIFTFYFFKNLTKTTIKELIWLLQGFINCYKKLFSPNVYESIRNYRQKE